MNLLAIAHKGLEDISALEIDELIKTKAIIKPGCVLFDGEKQDLALVCYKSQSIKKVMLLLDSFEIRSIKNIKDSVKGHTDEIKKYLTDDKTFAVRCLKQENDELSTEEVCLEAAEAFETKSKVNLNNPDIIIFLYICGKECYLGIDLSAEDLGKRDYRIYVHQEALKATIAYSLLRVAEYNKKETLLDPFCGSGTILIEAALFTTNTSPNLYSKDKFAFLKLFDFDLTKLDRKKASKSKLIGYDKELRHVVSAKKNAKIAGVEDIIEFSRAEIEWIDTKLKIQEKSIDKIITNPPNLIKRVGEQETEKLYNYLFYQADYILKKDGTVTLITKTPDLMKKSAEKYKFKIIHEREIMIGADKHNIFVFKK
jgi:23S rRNA G2445 N2-methylase RlmL